MAKGTYYVRQRWSTTWLHGMDRRRTTRHPAFLGLREASSRRRHATARLTIRGTASASGFAPVRASQPRGPAARVPARSVVDVQDPGPRRYRGRLSSIVLVAEPERLDVLRQRPDFSGALASTAAKPRRRSKPC